MQDAPTIPAFVSGFGRSDTHALRLDVGTPDERDNPHPDAGKPYGTITGAEIARMVADPPSVPKDRARWFIPSDYAEQDARGHTVQRERGWFWWLVLDLDKNDPALSDVSEALVAVTGADVTRLIHSSRSATPEGRKWRALVPLAEPIPGADYSDTARAFYDLIEQASAGVLIPDRALERSGQLIFLPNRGAHYEHEIHRGQRLRLTADHPIIRHREESRARLERDRTAAAAEWDRRKAARPPRRPGDGEDVIGGFNTAHTVAELLSRYGYAQLGASCDWRSPMQTSDTHATRDYGQFWLSLSGSDADAAIGNTTPRGHRIGDAFDLFCHFEHGGDFRAAVRAYAEETGMIHARRIEAPGAPAFTDDPVDLWGQFHPPALPHGLLPPILEQFARVQGARMGADPAGLAVAALVTCAAAITDGVKLKVKRHDDWTESARLWAALVGSPSTKKSPILSAATGPLCRIDAELFRDWQRAFTDWSNLDKAEQRSVPKPVQTRLRIEDATIEAAQMVLEGSPAGALLLQDELSGFFGAMDKYSGGKGANADRAFWLRSFNGGEYALNRVGRGAALIPNLSLCLLGGIQPEPIRKLAADAHDDGLLQRLFPIVLRPATLGHDEPAPDVVGQYRALIERLHTLRGPQGFTPWLVFDDRANGVRAGLEAEHLRLQSSEAVNRKLAAHVGKYDGLFARLCIVWHCVENADGPLPPAITEGTAERVAAFLHKFLLPHAFAFYAGTLGLSDDHDRLTAIAGYILAHRLERVTNRDVQRGDRAMRAIREQDIRPLLEQLAALGWLEMVPGPRPTQPPHWLVNPAVHARFADRASGEGAKRKEARKIFQNLAEGGA